MAAAGDVNTKEAGSCERQSEVRGSNKQARAVQALACLFTNMRADN